MMDNDNDFTFCQVGPPVNRDVAEAEALVADIDTDTISSEFGNASIGDPNDTFMWRNEFLNNNATSKKDATVGSLTFTVVDASSSTKSAQVSSKAALKYDDILMKDLQGKETPARKPVPPRAKVPFEKGYSQVDWLKLTRTHPDLAGLEGRSNKRLISKNEVKQHQAEGSMWTIFKGHVYNLSPYMKFHPGGVDMLMKAVGKDCTSLFNKYHAWVNAEFLLEKCRIRGSASSYGRDGTSSSKYHPLDQSKGLLSYNSSFPKLPLSSPFSHLSLMHFLHQPFILKYRPSPPPLSSGTPPSSGTIIFSTHFFICSCSHLKLQ